IYTGRGDRGKTDLWSSEHRVSKASCRIEGYGSVDELNGLLGHAASVADENVSEDIEHVQNQLHVLMAHLADRGEKGDKRVTEEHTGWLEDRIDSYSEDLEELDGFILPGGSHAGSILHYARSVCRRVERKIVELDDEEGVDEEVLAYINRLSDFIFVLARYQNRLDGAEEKSVEYE
ncbi:MAG: cob(I)yrinic acid a,c-diamide adenosyltransferase, partial [Candidatus Nanohaloarchaea archaeon]